LTFAIHPPPPPSPHLTCSFALSAPCCSKSKSSPLPFSFLSLSPLTAMFSCQFTFLVSRCLMQSLSSFLFVCIGASFQPRFLEPMNPMPIRLLVFFIPRRVVLASEHCPPVSVRRPTFPPCSSNLRLFLRPDPPLWLMPPNIFQFFTLSRFFFSADSFLLFLSLASPSNLSVFVLSDCEFKSFFNLFCKSAGVFFRSASIPRP